MGDPWLVIGLLVGGIVGLLLRYVIFRASCALVDVDPSQTKSILVVLFAFAVIIGVSIPVLLLPEMVTGVSVGLLVACFLVGVVSVWLILGLLYIPVLPVSVAKGLLLSGYEIILGLLLNSLVAGIVLVVYAVYQIVTNTGPGGQPRTEMPQPVPAINAMQRL